MNKTDLAMAFLGAGLILLSALASADEWYSEDPTPDVEPKNVSLEEGAIWISNLNATEFEDHLEIPVGYRARVAITPAFSGELNLFDQYPSRHTLVTTINSSAEVNVTYFAWFIADVSGNHTLWFMSGYERSDNEVTFTVF